MKTFDERREAVANYMQAIKKKRRKTILTVTGLTLVTAVLALVLFVPYDTTPPDVSMYADSDYYNLIQRLNEATYEKPRYKNNFEALRAALSSLDIRNAFDKSKGEIILFAPNAPNGSPGDAPSYGAPPQYEETTDNQVEGVIEADIIKRSDQYIYYLRGAELSVYSIAGQDSALVGKTRIDRIIYQEVMDELGEFSYYNDVEMYLSQDCSTVTVLIDGYGKTIGSCTVLLNLDVTDPANITEKNRFYFAGDYLSSRMVDGDILLTYNYQVSSRGIDFSDASTFVPQYGQPGSMTCIPADDIVCPENVDSVRYTVICRLDGDTLAVRGSTALLSYSQELYVSQDTIYATHSYTEKNSEVFNNSYKQKVMTEITGISYSGDTLEILGTANLEGSVKDQYSMDQYEDILRVVTSTAVTSFRETFYGEYASTTTDVTQRNVNLYCIDLSTWKIAASVVAFAPEGEEATSVRFDGPHAYVCTAEVITFSDPVYFFDLSDLNHITYTDTGTIDGYSTSLIDLGDGYLLGIGYGNDRSTLKIEVYEERDGKVISVCAYERIAMFSENYKSYLVDREHDLIGLGIYAQDANHAEAYMYLLLHFDGYTLNEVAAVPMDGYYFTTMRGVLIDGWLYTFSDATENNFRVIPIG